MRKTPLGRVAVKNTAELRQAFELGYMLADIEIGLDVAHLESVRVGGSAPTVPGNTSVELSRRIPITSNEELLAAPGEVPRLDLLRLEVVFSAAVVEAAYAAGWEAASAAS